MIKNRIIKYYFKKADYYSDERQCKKAISYLDKILVIDKYNNLDALSSKGFCYADLYDKENSFKCFDELSKLIPNEVGIDLNKGIACSILNEFELAIECFDKFLAEYPDNINALSLKGLCYSFLGDYDKALNIYDKVLEKENDYITIVRKGLCYSKLKKYDEAISCIEKILEPYCENATVLGSMCDILMSKGDYENALIYADKILKLNPNEIQVIIMKSKILAELGQFKESIKGFERVSKVEFDKYAIINDYYLYYGQSLELMGKYDEALKIYDEYLNKYPHFPKDEILKEKEKITNKLTFEGMNW